MRELEGVHAKVDGRVNSSSTAFGGSIGPEAAGSGFTGHDDRADRQGGLQDQRWCSRDLFENRPMHQVHCKTWMGGVVPTIVLHAYEKQRGGGTTVVQKA